MGNAIRQLRPVVGCRRPTVYACGAHGRYLRARRPSPVHHRSCSRPRDLATRYRVPLKRTARSRRQPGSGRRRRHRRQPGDQTSLRRRLPEGPLRYRTAMENKQRTQYQFRLVHRHSSLPPSRSTYRALDAPPVPWTQSLLPKDLPNHQITGHLLETPAHLTHPSRYAPVDSHLAG